MANLDSKLRFILDCAFNYEPAGKSFFYDIDGARKEYNYSEFWWRSCVLKDNMMHGEQGYLTVWWDGENLEHYHSYRNPTNGLAGRS
jgi:hypothetical protein